MRRTNPPKGKSKSRRRKKPGPKSSCTEEVITQAYRLCLLGLTDEELAVAFDKDRSTINHWKRTNSKFKQAIEQGRKFSSGEVVDALFQRAVGYEHPATKFYKDRVTEKEFDEEGNVVSEKSYSKIIKVPYTKKYPPDVKAAIKILGVRHRETWGESYKVDHRHRHSHMHVGDINIHQILEQISDVKAFSDEELKVIAKLGLSNQATQLTNGQNN